MFELKLAVILGNLYRAYLRFALRSINKRQDKALATQDRQISAATSLENAGYRLIATAQRNIDSAEREYSDKYRAAMSARNAIENALDDATHAVDTIEDITHA